MAKEKPVKEVIHAKDTEITVLSYVNADDYISLTDIARYKNPEFPADIVKNWMRMRNTIEFLGLWEELNNPEFKLVEFDQFKNDAGSNAFVLSPQKWIKSTNAIGMVSKSGRYGGGTFAHKDIAFEFASWISPEFKLYIIKDYQRLKEDESHRLALDWNVNRVLAKTNYRIHTDAIKETLIPPELPKEQHRFVYADEADVLNVALLWHDCQTVACCKPRCEGEYTGLCYHRAVARPGQFGVDECALVTARKIPGGASAVFEPAGDQAHDQTQPGQRGT